MELTINITRNCNLNCPFCYLKHKKDSISTDQLKHILKVVNNIKNVTITGGEPFLHNDIFDILNILRKNKLKINLITNGHLLTSDKITKLSYYDIEVYLSYNKHDIKILNIFKKIIEENITLNTMTLFDKYKLRKLPIILKDISVAKKNFFLYPINLESNLDMPNPNQWFRMIDKLSIMSKKYSQKIYYQQSFLKEKNYRPCPSGISIFVDANGKAYPCCLTVDIIKGSSTILPIKINSPNICQDCKGGCPALAIKHGHDPRCNKNYLPICPLIYRDIRNS